jgi:hypothetical protein
VADVLHDLSDAQRRMPAAATRPRLPIAWGFGIVLPIACFVFDPIVFTEMPYARFSVGAYLLSAAAIVALFLNLTQSGRAGDHDVVRGVIFSAGIFALVVGVVILPWSVLGLVVAGVGLFGLIPFGTAYVYLRRGWPTGIVATRSLRRIASFLSGMILPAVVVGSVQVLANAHVERSLLLALSSSEREQRQGIEGLRYSFWCGPACLYWTYVDLSVRDGLLFEHAFQETTGETFDQWRSGNFFVATGDD